MALDIGEKESVSMESQTTGQPKLDRHGLPLIPQPSDDPEDVCTPQLESRAKVYHSDHPLAGVVLRTFFALMHEPGLRASRALVACLCCRGIVYRRAIISFDCRLNLLLIFLIGTIGIAAAGIGSFIWAPLSNVYGRRPILIISQAIAIAASFGSAYAKTWGTIVLGRFFVGLGVASGNVVCFAVVSDLFCLHERGKMLGIVTVALINGPHVASLPGGFIAQFVSWRWTLLLPSITSTICWILIIIGLPETLYVRNGDTDPIQSVGKLHRYRITGAGGTGPTRKLRLIDFARPFQMLKYIPIVILGLYAAVAFTLGSVMPAQTVSALFRTFYQWRSARTGVALSVSTTVGGVLGEVVSGPVIDKLLERSRKREGRVRPEARLHGMWPAVFLLPAGLLMFGFCIANHELKHSYVGATVGMAITCFSVQMITTPIIAYCVDCYKPQAAEVVQLLNFARQEISFTVGFWSLRFGDKVGFQFSGVTYALVSLLFFLPVLYLMRYGERLRARLGEPGFNKGL
ncbi:MFS general substrate transporter [Mycena indigotica]|uniref:MFS general substrate transporter n=1 Tax=Mycena indigotica TaxID=2126181 RepID=A0A8H6RZB3_9AGAR|nr:MFS general substrate transporter [Mycena indigotica]KAF7289002.1 MFS general substrate transporter [Mycena indigotica]